MSMTLGKGGHLLHDVELQLPLAADSTGPILTPLYTGSIYTQYSCSVVVEEMQIGMVRKKEQPY